MTRAIVLLVQNDDGSETAAAVLQVDGDVVETTSGEDLPRAYRLFNAPTAYAEGLARDARGAGDVDKARLEDWVGWIVDELADIHGMRVVEVAPARDLAYLYDREITLHPPEGWQSVNDEDDEPEPEVRQKDASSAGQSPPTKGTGATEPAFTTTAEQEAETERWWTDLLEESRARDPQPSRITFLVPPMATVERGPGAGDAAGSATNQAIGSTDNLLDLIPAKRPDAFDALMRDERALRGRIFLAMWADGYSESVAWAIALAPDVSGVTGVGGFLDVSDDRSMRTAVEARRSKGV